VLFNLLEDMRACSRTPDREVRLSGPQPMSIVITNLIALHLCRHRLPNRAVVSPIAFTGATPVENVRLHFPRGHDTNINFREKRQATWTLSTHHPSCAPSTIKNPMPTFHPLEQNPCMPFRSCRRMPIERCHPVSPLRSSEVAWRAVASDNDLHGKPMRIEHRYVEMHAE
jgi:hypothetical protein